MSFWYLGNWNRGERERTERERQEGHVGMNLILECTMRVGTPHTEHGSRLPVSYSCSLGKQFRHDY